MGCGARVFLLWSRGARGPNVKDMKKSIVSVSLGGLLGLLLAGCAVIGNQGADTAAPQAEEREAVRPLETVRPPATARTVEQFDTTSADEKKAAVVAAEEKAASGQGRALGRTVASLGDAAQPGLWIKTPLVSAPATGRVLNKATGKAVELDLLPLSGPTTAGSRMSLAALRVIEAGLTDLTEVEVFIN